MNCKNTQGLTPLHLAVGVGRDPIIVDTLLKHGADPELKDNAGRTTFDIASTTYKTADKHFKDRRIIDLLSKSRKGSIAEQAE